MSRERDEPPRAAGERGGRGARPGAGRLRRGLGIAKSGSTRESTWQRRRRASSRSAPARTLIARTELAPAAPLGKRLATLGHLTDAHVMDAESPARVPFLSQLGQPFNSTFRPQEALTAQVMDGAVRAVDALGPDAVIQGGDLIDNAQENELVRGLALLAGGRVDPGSGARRYHGVQEAGDADPFYYRPDIDAPRYPGLLAAATRRFHAAGSEGALVPGARRPRPARAGDPRADRADRPDRPRRPRGLAAADRPGSAGRGERTGRRGARRAARSRASSNR